MIIISQYFFACSILYENNVYFYFCQINSHILAIYLPVLQFCFNLLPVSVIRYRRPGIMSFDFCSAPHSTDSCKLIQTGLVVLSSEHIHINVMFHIRLELTSE